jgi:hypothetical protein
MIRIIALRLALFRACAKWRKRLFSTIASPAWTRMTATLLRPAERWLPSISTLCWKCIAWWDGCLAIISSIDWARLRMNASGWLRQPCDPTQWRLLDSRLFEGMFRVNHKKM